MPFAPPQSVSAAEQASLDAKADKPTTITKNADYTLTAADSMPAAAIATLWLSGSMQYAAAIAALIFVPLGVTLRR